MKKVIVSLIIAAAIVYGGWYARNKKHAVAIKPVETTTVSDLKGEMFTNAFIAQTAEIDSDSDGLKDWEESLWQTDPHKADTDGDSTKDGAEVAAGRNPVVKGPHDQLEITNKTATPANDDNSPKTITDAFSRQFFARYLELKKSGVAITPEVETNLIKELLNQGYFAPDGKLYANYDLTVNRALNADSADAIFAYGNAVGKILLKYAPKKGTENEYVILERSFNDENEKEVDKLAEHVSDYERTVRDLLKVPTPPSATSLHLAFINATARVLDSIRAMKNLYKDPVASYGNVAKYPENIDALANSIKDLKSYFFEKDVTFQQADPGYALVSSI
ncbi:hypothetical protein KW783_03805 [Candidatus Parcubacteria bacterium]|nr:hypothetical protein [Candidatus Parcubacteria bacterium]